MMSAQKFPRHEFEAAVNEHKAERHARGFECWTQFVAMLFCQLGHTQSLREIIGGLAAAEGRLDHCGVKRPPSRSTCSTLAYANAHRPWDLFKTVFHRLYEHCRRQAGARGGRKLRFKHKLRRLDSTMVPLCLSLFDRAQYR